LLIFAFGSFTVIGTECSHRYQCMEGKYSPYHKTVTAGVVGWSWPASL